MHKPLSRLLLGAMFLASFVPFASARTPWASWHRMDSQMNSSAASSAATSSVTSATVTPPKRGKVDIGESERKRMRHAKINIKKYMAPDGRHKL